MINIKGSYKKNICIFTNTLCSGGAEKQAVLLAKALNKKFNVWLVVYYGNQIEDKFLKIIEENGIKTKFLHGNHLTKLLSFFQFLKQERIDVIFSYLLTTNLIGGLIGKMAGVKKTIGGIRTSKLSKRKEFIQKFLQDHINDLTIYNNFKGLDLLAKSGFRSSKAKVILNCFEINTKERVRDKEELVTILSVGRFHEAKNYKTAIKAIYELRKKRTDFIYQIIGYGHLENDIRNWINDFNAQDFVEIIINPENIDKYYQNADVYLMTSIFEGLSNTVLEAMSFSLPLVLTDVGDNDRLVVNSENGYLCDVGDIKQICQKLELLVNDYNKRIEFGLNSYNMLKENYSYEKFQKNYFELIENLENK